MRTLTTSTPTTKIRIFLLNRHRAKAKPARSSHTNTESTNTPDQAIQERAPPWNPHGRRTESRVRGQGPEQAWSSLIGRTPAQIKPCLARNGRRNYLTQPQENREDRKKVASRRVSGIRSPAQERSVDREQREGGGGDREGRRDLAERRWGEVHDSRHHVFYMGRTRGGLPLNMGFQMTIYRTGPTALQDGLPRD
jgi:hypothetical protein